MAMKKTLCMMLSLVILFSFAISVSAAQQNNTLLKYDNPASYEITIPTSIDINGFTKVGLLEIDVSMLNLAPETMVSIYVSSPNYDNGWQLTNTKDYNDKLEYTIGTFVNGSDIINGSAAVTTSTVNNFTLYLTLAEDPRVGNFTDTLTFTSVITDSVINFTIDGVKYQATDDMAWDEWVKSAYNLNDAFQSYGSTIKYGDNKYLSSDGKLRINYTDVIIANKAYVTID